MDLAAFRARLKPPGPVIDVHVHPLPLRGPAAGPGPEGVFRAAADFLVRNADRAGVDKMVLMNIGRSWSRSPTPREFCLDNDECLKIRDLAPERFVSFCYVNPAHPDESLAELDRCVGREGMVGVKLWVAVRASDPRVKAIAERAVALDVPVLQHAWIKAGGNDPGESTPDDVAALGRAVPHARIIMAHLHGSRLRGMDAIAGVPNVSAETGGSEPERGVVAEAVRRLGTRRVLFGSDATGRHFATSIAKVTGDGLSVAAQRRILWDNLARLLPERAGVKSKGDTAPLPEDLRR
jgi:predicted TIM-barrel fold metal-dependent hydrolase